MKRKGTLKKKDRRLIYFLSLLVTYVKSSKVVVPFPDFMQYSVRSGRFISLFVSTGLSRGFQLLEQRTFSVIRFQKLKDKMGL